MPAGLGVVCRVDGGNRPECRPLVGLDCARAAFTPTEARDVAVFLLLAADQVEML